MTPGERAGAGVSTASLYPILSVNFVGTLGFSIVLPFLVFLVTKFGGNAFVYGVMGATYSGFQLIGAPLLGRWSDVYGRKKILFLSQLGTLLSWVIFLAESSKQREEPTGPAKATATAARLGHSRRGGSDGAGNRIRPLPDAAGGGVCHFRSWGSGNAGGA